MTDRCGCGAPLPIGVRFCVRCGAETAAQDRRERRARRRRDGRRLLAVPWLFLAPLAAIIAAGALSNGDAVDGSYVAWHAGLLLLALLGSAPLLGIRALPAGLERRPGLRATLLALPAAAVALLAGVGWILLLRQLAPEAVLAEPAPSVAEWLLVLLVAPLLEEWLCRGLLWRALEPFAAPASRNAATAVLFAFLHGLNGGYVLEVPHRFAAGLAFGWLRLQDCSLWPCVLAHLLTNLAAVLLD